ncbi:MAG: OmpA family protein [Phycisphaerales bacterium]|nr:OmpA family protein [Phycisphaerales bacterium]
MADEHDKEHKGHRGGGGHGGGGHGPGGGGHAEGEHEGAPEWLISFADNVMLMMGFFVILLALNMGPKGSEPHGANAEFDTTGQPSEAMLDLAIAIREAFNNPVDEGSNNPADQPLRQRLMDRRNVGQTERPGPDGDKHDLQSIRAGDFIAPCGLVPFDDESSLVSTDGREIAASVARSLAGHRFIIEVRGHVSASESYRLPHRGMDLAYARAMAVATVLESGGVAWERLRIVSSGDNERVTGRAENDQGHRSNQRVEIFQTEETVALDPYAGAETTKE